MKKTIDALGLQLWGYMRGGFYGARNGAPKGQYQLGGDLQHGLGDALIKLRLVHLQHRHVRTQRLAAIHLRDELIV